jgi:hypothetical protein
MAKSGNPQIFERVGNVVYAREFGDIKRYMTKESREKFEKEQQTQQENAMWEDIRNTAKTNKALQSALEQCIIIYKLSKEYKDGI